MATLEETIAAMPERLRRLLDAQRADFQATGNIQGFAVDVTPEELDAIQADLGESGCFWTTVVRWNGMKIRAERKPLTEGE